MRSVMAEKDPLAKALGGRANNLLQSVDVKGYDAAARSVAMV